MLSKRPDGYHNLETCFYPVPWMDVLEVIHADEFEFTSSGNFIPGVSSENLCVKAYTLLKKDLDLSSVKIHLHKVIPSGAGLGGGSSDAAYTLRLLNELFDLKLSSSLLIEYAARLGSDCAFFIQDKAMLGEGRGEILKEIPLSLKGKFLIVVKPDVHVSTADAFKGITPREPHDSIEKNITQYPVRQWKNFLHNDFEDSVFVKYPSIKSLKEKLYSSGASYASMSGSGSAVYGIFEEAIDIRFEFAGNQYWSGYL